MKTFIKTFVVPSLFLVAISTQVSAQTRRSTTAVASNNTEKTTKTTRVTPVKTSPANSRVVSSKVTYKTPQKKVVSVRNIPNKTVVSHKGQNYYYGNNKYYTQSRGHYITIAPKVGFRINTLPANYKRIKYNNYNYYNAHGIFYVQINNAYEVVEPEIGTLVYELPDDYEKVTLDGQTYYEYANILYEKVQVNGTRAYEIVGIIDMV
ncbi:DUF6515 family protein [Mariniflexile sp. AS56]|uniref:DUF6515 family protein n=1 Tax=Mariniflexile sp. AS56 TaxID=3063957 RepID=UPI0026ECFD3B|nr:DUF6515 family protein [Mariniflexile sp. AS56]MDO7173522.1 DUF6515 family protein [Mariniflexile sp. AS56]